MLTAACGDNSSIAEAVPLCRAEPAYAPDFFNYEWIDAEGGRHRLLD